MIDGHAVAEYRELCQAGWELNGVTSQVCFNDGSETLRHFIGKSVAGYICVDEGYRISSEESVHGSECDILAWGHPGRSPIVIEIETDKTEEIEIFKRDAFSCGPVREVFVLEANRLPSDIEEMESHIRGKIGL